MFYVVLLCMFIIWLIFRKKKAKSTTKGIATGEYVELEVVGESFDNEDGTSRQAILARCQEGDYIELRRQPKNKYDKNAIGVFTELGQIGHVSRELAKGLAPIMNRGVTFEGRIKRILGGTKNKPSYGCIIEIEDKDV